MDETTAPSDADTRVVQTVLGPLPSEQLGIVMTHEHVLWDGSRAGGLRPVVDPEGQRIAEEPVSIGNLWWVRQNYTLSRDNIVLDDVSLAISELSRYRDVGGGTVVDATHRGLGRSPEVLAHISSASGVAIVMGSGYYVRTAHPQELASRSASQIEEELVEEVTHGVDGTSVRSGIIGEIGCSWPIDPVEDRVLRAAAHAQRRTGVPLLIHPGRASAAVFDHLRVAERAGADLRRTIMSHVDRRIGDLPTLIELARTGCYLEFDCFGLEPWLDPQTIDCPMPCDLERIEWILGLLDAGHGDRILVAQDIAMKHRLATFGGHGYDHVVRNIVPVLRGRGASEDEVMGILVENPRRVLET
jgi:phosphotriesterase-related protein